MIVPFKEVISLRQSFALHSALPAEEEIFRVPVAPDRQPAFSVTHFRIAGAAPDVQYGVDTVNRSIERLTARTY